VTARTLRGVTPCAVACILIAACGGGVPAAGSRTGAPLPAGSTSTAAPADIPVAHPSGGQRLLDWPEFGLDPQRSNVSERATAITRANVAHLRHIAVRLPGTADSSPIYVHGALVGGATRNVAVVTTTYGRTVAIDADSGRILWTFTPPGYGRVAGSSQITTTSPLVDPSRAFVYAASPDGLVHKLALASGTEAREGSWPVSVTRDASHEKLAAALNVVGGDLVAVTGGYFGDAPPYQGHVVLIERARGRVRAVFNTLCANRTRLITPSNCSASDSAIWARAGAVIEPGGARMLIATGNGPWNGSTNFGDSVLELTLPNLRLRQSYTPRNQAQLNSSDTDLGSSAPVLLGNGRVARAGTDGFIRVLALARPAPKAGAPPGARPRPLAGSCPSPPPARLRVGST